MSYLSLRYTFTPAHPPEHYTTVEIEPVKEVPGEHCIVDYEEPSFFSVYARHKDGTAECIGDFGQYAWAHKFAVDMVHQHGWRISDRVPSKFR